MTSPQSRKELFANPEELYKVISFPNVVDSTMTTTLDSCRQRFFNEYILQLAPRGKSIDLHAGGCLARGFEVARLALWRDGQPLSEALYQATEAMFEYWGDYDDSEEDTPKDFVNTVNALYSYFQEYPPETDPIKPYLFGDNNAPAVEYTFAIPMNLRHPDTGDPLIFGGRFDLLGYYQDFLAIVDEKSTKAMGPTWSKQWGLRGQFIGYVKAAQLAGIPVQHAVIRGIAIQKTQYKHMQSIEHYPHWLVDRWWGEIHSKWQQAINYYTAMKAAMQIDAPAGVQFNPHPAWPMSFGDGCSSYGGCMYLDTLCRSENPADFYTYYSHRVWDPLHKDPTDTSPDEKVEIISAAEAGLPGY